ncbi:hypothetical protein H2203_004873 [Taxawa tesnikishii (nom. ined.)]|nr:hypothetical protein H2203_004873 [Dothideales sp. JES 119]
MLVDTVNLQQSHGAMLLSPPESPVDNRNDEVCAVERISLAAPAAPKKRISVPNMALPQNSSESFGRLTPKGSNDDLSTPPETPSKSQNDLGHRGSSASEDIALDISNLNLDSLDDSQLLGIGLWSKVYRVVVPSPSRACDGNSNIPTPPTTPREGSWPQVPRVFALKKAIRPDAISVLSHEAHNLTHLHSNRRADDFITPFFGLSACGSALVLHAANAGSLENLTTSLSTHSASERHATVVRLFPILAQQLISGLDFMHQSGIVHADIKPANILLDRSSQDGSLIARYCDFSASFRVHEESPSDVTTSMSNQHPAAGGGTWSYMAPEQLSTNRTLSTPTRASDPFANIEARSNFFMLREAVKCARPLEFAREDPEMGVRITGFEVEARMGGFDALACVALALKKDRGERVRAADWKEWVVGAASR